MPITCSCSCGRRLVLDDKIAGKRIRCPECGVILEVPQPSSMQPPHQKSRQSKKISRPARRERGFIDEALEEESHWNLPPRQNHRLRPENKSPFRWKAVILAGALVGGVGIFVVLGIGLLHGTNGVFTGLNSVSVESRTATKGGEVALEAGPPIVNSIGMKLQRIPAATVTLGGKAFAHPVTFEQPFYIGVTEVTQGQYVQVVGDNPSKHVADDQPVECLSWQDATDFCRRLSEQENEKQANRVYRLPTSAEWEYACRAGTTSQYYFGDDPLKLVDHAWFVNNSGVKPLDGLKIPRDRFSSTTAKNNSRPHPVAQKTPNPFGLYDMLGNVCEYCQDQFVDVLDRDVTGRAVVARQEIASTGGGIFVGGDWLSMEDSLILLDGLPIPATKRETHDGVLNIPWIGKFGFRVVMYVDSISER